MKKWLIGLTLLALLATGVVGLAQDKPVFCGDLKTADCTLLKDSATVMQSVQSTTFAMKSTMKVANIPGVPVNSLEFHMNAAGSFGGGKTSSMESLVVPGAETTAATLFKALANVMREVKGNMTVTFELPADLTKLLGNTSLPKQIALDFRMLDGVAYINLAQIAAIDPKLGIPKGWVGIDVGQLYADVLPGQLAGATAGAFDIAGMVGEMGKLENVEKFAHIERLADAEVSGHKVAVFRTTIDYQAMMDIAAFRKMLEGIMTAQGAKPADATKALEMIREMYKGMSIDVTESIGLEDKRVYSTEITFGWDMSGMPGMKPGAAPQLNMNMVINTSAINEKFTVLVPEDVLLLPLKSMLPKQ